MNGGEIREMIEYYRGQGAPQDQQMLIALLREAQEKQGGALSQDMLEAIAAAYQMKTTLLQALIRRVPGCEWKARGTGWRSAEHAVWAQSCADI